MNTVIAIKGEINNAPVISKIADADLAAELKRLEILQGAVDKLPAEAISSPEESTALKAAVQQRINLVKGAITRANMRAARLGEQKRSKR